MDETSVGGVEVPSSRRENLVYKTAHEYFRSKFEKRGWVNPESQRALEIQKKVGEKIAAHQQVLIVGMDVACHNTGISLVEIDETGTARVLYSMEEERFNGQRYSNKFPSGSLRELNLILKKLGKSAADIDAWVDGWNYPMAAARGVSEIAHGLPFSSRLLNQENTPDANFDDIKNALSAQDNIYSVTGERPTIIGMHHHDAHSAAYFLSPFFSAEPKSSDRPVMLLVADGYGDNSSLTESLASGTGIKKIYENSSIFNSLGVLYSAVSASIGGFPPLASEGRIMGAAGLAVHRDRESNPYYQALKAGRLVIEKGHGRIEINKNLLNVHLAGMSAPFTPELIKILGQPIPQKDFWNPDKIMSADDLEHLKSSEQLSQADRLDKAAALQLVLEDALEYIVEDFIRQSQGSDKLVFSGGVALNCIATLHLAEKFGREYYKKHFGTDRTLEIWTPPTPSDTGIAMGSALEFARRAGAKNFAPLKHAFLGGLPPQEVEIKSAIEHDPQARVVELGNINENRAQIADLLAHLVSRNHIIGLFQGSAEAGPRALGHRSFLANPANPDLRKFINDMKKREAIRPVAPMMTESAMHKYLEVPEAFAADNYNALRFMVVALNAKPEAVRDVPAIVHGDGSVRVQLDDPESDPFVHEYLLALGRYTGAEVSINTSLNVGSPIVQTPEQAFAAMHKAGRLGGILMIAENGQAFMTYLDRTTKSQIDGLDHNFGQEMRTDLDQYLKQTPGRNQF